MDTPRHAGTPSTDPLQYETKQHDTALVYRCTGAFSLANHDRLGMLAEEVRRSGAAHVVLDLREVVYMDSVGVGAIAVALKDTRARNRQLTVVPSGEIRTLLIASRLVGILSFAESPEAALGS